MRRGAIFLLLALAGCQFGPRAGPLNVEPHIAAVAPARIPAVPELANVLPAYELADTTVAQGLLDLPIIWDLTLANNPSLREAAADVEAARGRLVQAGLYPNPRLLYGQDTIGSRIARQGNFLAEVNQEIVTAGKRRLDMAVASRQADVASLALLGRKFDVLTRVRHAYYNYVGWVGTVKTNEEIVAVLENGLKITRRLVEEVKTRPQTDLIRTEALLEEAQINLVRSQANRDGAWRQLAAEVGVRDLPMKETPANLPEHVPQWNVETIERRVLAANTALREAGVEVERSRLALTRARAQMVPNVLVGGGYTADNTDNTAGGALTVEAPLPLWDRNQGNIHSAQAQLAKAQASVRTVATRLSGETAAGFAAYAAARQQMERLTAKVVPKLEDSLKQLQKGYQAGVPQVTFADVFQAEQALLTARLTLADSHRTLWLAIADLQGLMQIDLGEELGDPLQPCDPSH